MQEEELNWLVDEHALRREGPMGGNIYRLLTGCISMARRGKFREFFTSLKDLRALIVIQSTVNQD